MEDSNFNNQRLVNSIDDTFGDDLFDLNDYFLEIFSSSASCTQNSISNNNPQASMVERHVKQLDPTNFFSYSTSKEISKEPYCSSSSSHLISFENSNSSCLGLEKPYRNIVGKRKNYVPFHNVINSSFSLYNGSFENQYCSPDIMGSKRVCTVTRTPLQAQDHVMTERKRREKMTQLFVSLSQIVPGLKKLDKASLLGDAVKYMKELEERVRILEEEAKKSSVETAASAQKSSTFTYDVMSSSKENFDGTIKELFPDDIKVRISNKNVLIKVCCKKRNGIVSRIQREMEYLHLTILEMRVMSFGYTTLDITILAEINGEFCMAVKDIVKNLQLALSI